MQSEILPRDKMEGYAALFVTSWKRNSYCPANWKLITDICENTLKKKSELSAIYCTVLDVELSEEQREDATRYGVTLIPATRPKWSKPDEDPPAIHWLLNHYNYYPGFAKSEDITHVVGLYAKTHNAASAIHESLFQQAKLHLVPSKPAALFVGNSWRKDELGLTGFHRTLIQDFCERKAKAGEDLKAYSTVLDVQISDDQKKDAESCGVTLIPAQRRLGIEPKSDPPKTEWLLNHESYFPDLGKIEDIEYVVGYAPKTGHAAANIRAKLFPKAKLVLINHASPESHCLEAEEYGLLEFEEKMLQMASLADLLFSIGPVIYEYFQNAYRAEFHGKELSEIPHEEILPIPLACFTGRDPVLRETSTHGILTCGQLDTQKAIERCERIAASIGTAANCLSESQSPINPPSWKIQGVSQQADQTVVKFLSNKMQCHHIQPKLHPRHSAKYLHRSLQQSHLCLPAPCYVDYSLYGLEAMVSGLPTATYNHTHLAGFITQYLTEHADNCVVGTEEKNLSQRILKDLRDVPLAFKKAKDLKIDLLQSEVISASSARFASLLTTNFQQQTGTYQKDHGVKTDEKDELKTGDTPEKPDEMSMKPQQTVSENKGKTSETNTAAVFNGKGNETDKSAAILPVDSLTVQIGLDENVQQQDLRELEEEVKTLPAHVRQELMEEVMEEVMTTLRAALKRRVEDVLRDEDGSQKIRNTCKQKLGDVDPSSLTAKSLAILLRFLTLYNLYRLKQTCRSGSLARAFEPLLITDEMRELAAKVGITLRLRATYDEKRFKDVELFFINRDGGGIKPMMTYDDVPAVDTDPLQLILLKLDPVHEIHQSTETNVCSLFKAEEYIRQKGSQFDIIQVVMTMTDRIQHILSSRQELLSLLSVTRYLVTDVSFEDLTFPELDEQLTQHGTLTPPITVLNETLSLQARSLLPLQTSEQQQLTDSDIRYLALAQSTVQSTVQSLQNQLDIALKEKSKFQAALTEKIILESQLAEALNEKSQLEKQCLEYKQQCQIAENKVTTQLSEIPTIKRRSEILKAELVKKDKLLTELRTKLEQVSDEQTDVELQKKTEESLQLGEKSSISETEQEELSETSLHKVYTKTNINEFEKEATTSEMTGSKGNEMETATPTQPEMTVRDGSEMETAKPTQPEMTGMEEHGIKTEAVTTATEHQKGKRDSSDIFGKFFKRLTGRKDKTDGSKVMSIGKKELSGSVTAGIKELSSSSGPVLSVMSGGTSTLPGSKEEQSGSYSDGSGKGSDSESMEETVGGGASSAGRWSRRTLKGHQGQKFQDVRGLAFHNDKLLVCDRDNNIVHILNQDYTCEKELGSFSGQLAKPFQPQSIAVSQDNLYFILDASNVQIVVCDQNNKVIRIITLPTDSHPWCIALVKRFVIVTDVKGHRVLKYSQTGQYISEFGRRGDLVTQFDWPGFVAVNSKDVIMVSDRLNYCIKCFDTDLNYLYRYGHYGTGDGQLYYPASIAVDGTDHVYVCDPYKARISIWSRDGTWICNLFHHQVSSPFYMAVTADGDRIAVCRWSSNEINVFSK